MIYVSEGSHTRQLLEFESYLNAKFNYNCRDLLRIYTGFIKPNLEGSKMTMNDADSLRIQILTLDELSTEAEGIFEDYPFYDFVREEWEAKLEIVRIKDNMCWALKLI